MRKALPLIVVVLAGLLVPAGASAAEQELTLYSPPIKTLPYVHDTHALTLRADGKEAPDKPGFITGVTEQVLVDSKDPDAEPLGNARMMIHHLLYFAPGRAGDAEHGDMHRDWECQRAAKVWSLHSSQDDIRRSEKRIVRLRSEWKRGNLTKWVADAIERHNRIAASILADLPECTHRPETRRECTAEESLPDCTC